MSRCVWRKGPLITSLQQKVNALGHDTAARLFVALLLAIISLLVILLLLLLPDEVSSGSYSAQYDLPKKSSGVRPAHPAGYYDRGIDRSGGMQSDDHGIYQLGDFTLSLSGGTYRHLIVRVSVAFDGDPEAFSEAMQQYNPLIRHGVIRGASGIDGESLETRSGKEAFEKLVGEIVAGKAGHAGAISDVFFSRFILQ